MTALLLSLPLLAVLSAAVVRALIARPILDQPAPRKAHARPTAPKRDMIDAMMTAAAAPRGDGA